MREMFKCILIVYLLIYIHGHKYTPNICLGGPESFSSFFPNRPNKEKPFKERYMHVCGLVVMFLWHNCTHVHIMMRKPTSGA